MQCLPENNIIVPALELTISVADVQPLYESSAPADHADTRRRADKRSSKATKASAKSAKKPTKRSTDSQNGPTESSVAPVIKVLKPTPLNGPTARVAFTVENLWPGEIYQFIAAASNRCGVGEFSKPNDYVKMEATAPDPPRQPVVVNIQQRQVDVEWEKPRSNGCDIIQYTLYWVQADDATAINASVKESIALLTHSIVGTRFTLLGLSPGKPLQAWVSAANLIDNKLQESELSPASDVVQTLCDVPDQPSPAPRLLDPTSHSLALAFTPPNCNGLPIIRYDVVLYIEEIQFGVNIKQVERDLCISLSDLHELPVSMTTQSKQSTDDEAAVAFTIDKLRGRSFYSAEICAVNELGAGPMSACSVPAGTLPACPPQPIPEPLTVTDVTPSTALIAWNRPVHDGGAPITSYQVQYSVRSVSSMVLPSKSAVEAEIEELSVFDGLHLAASFLKPKREYRFRVAPRNASGIGPYSAWSDPVTTPSLVEFTVATYFATRPEVEHVKARAIQVRRCLVMPSLVTEGS